MRFLLCHLLALAKNWRISLSKDAMPNGCMISGPKEERSNNSLKRERAQFLYRIQPVRLEMLTGGSTDDERRMVEEHFAYLKHLTNTGTVLLAGRTRNIDSSSFGIVIFSAESEETARRIMNEDPAVKSRVFRAELFPYRMALFNPKNSEELLGNE